MKSEIIESLILICLVILMVCILWVGINIPVPEEQVCDFQNGYWGFKVVCNDGFFGWKNSNRVIDQHFHEDLESCKESLKFYVSYENCGVVE